VTDSAAAFGPSRREAPGRRHRTKGHDVDDGSPAARQQRHEGLGDVEGPVQVDRQVLLERISVGQIVGERDAGVVDQNVKGLHLLDGRLDLCPVGHVEREGRDALIGDAHRLSRGGVHPLGTHREGFVNQRPSEAAVGSGHQHRLVGYCRHVLRLLRRWHHVKRPAAPKLIGVGR
jgi:hypothetical protein